MRKPSPHSIALFLLALLAVTAAPALAGDEDGDRRQVVIIDDDGQEHTITLDGSLLEVVSSDGDEVSVCAFDLAALAPVIDEAVATAVAGVDRALAGLRDRDVRLRVDDDLLTVAHGEDVHAVNLRALSREIGQAVDEVRRELDEEFGGPDGRRGRRSLTGDMADLRAEIDALRAELKRLQAELRDHR